MLDVEGDVRAQPAEHRVVDRDGVLAHVASARIVRRVESDRRVLVAAGDGVDDERDEGDREPEDEERLHPQPLTDQHGVHQQPYRDVGHLLREHRPPHPGAVLGERNARVPLVVAPDAQPDVLQLGRKVVLVRVAIGVGDVRVMARVRLPIRRERHGEGERVEPAHHPIEPVVLERRPVHAVVMQNEQTIEQMAQDGREQQVRPERVGRELERDGREVGERRKGSRTAGAVRR